jgi:hypothetical protein
LPLRGGAANKVGNRYERQWTVLALLDVLAGDGEYIRIEYPGDAGRGAEFLLLRDGIREWHQVKRQHVRGAWSIASLDRAGVLGPWWPKLENGDRCVFVSSTSAQQLVELIDRAEQAESWTEFDEIFLLGEHRDHFERLRLAWGNPPDAAVFGALRRVGAEAISEKQVNARALDRAARLVDGDPGTVVRHLAEIADNSLHHRVAAPDIWRLLDKTRPASVRPKADEDRERYVAGTRQSIDHATGANVHVHGDYNRISLRIDRRRWAGRTTLLLIASAAVLVAIAAVAGYLAARSSGTPEYFQTGPEAGIYVPPSTATCHNITPDVLTSPAENVFADVAEMHGLAVDGRAAFLMQGINGDMTYEWVVSDPNGTFGGMQLQWWLQGGSLHSCTVTLNNESPAALAQQGIRQLSSLAVPTVINGESVFIRACVWYTVRKDDIKSQCWS